MAVPALFHALKAAFRPRKKASKAGCTVQQVVKERKAAVDSPAIQIAKQYFMAYNDHDSDEIKNLSAYDCVIKFDASKDELLLQYYLEMLGDVVKSFPDFRLDVEEGMEEVETEDASSRCTTIVTVSGVRASGTHTGKPFAFGPFPEIPAAGVEVKDPVTSTNFMHIRGGKVTKLVIKTDGRAHEAGPAYFYTKIGGIIF